jgi:hypothetical protein
VAGTPRLRNCGATVDQDRQRDSSRSISSAEGPRMPRTKKPATNCSPRAARAQRSRS